MTDEFKTIETKATETLASVQATLTSLEEKAHTGWEHWQPWVCFGVGVLLGFMTAHHYHL